MKTHSPSLGGNTQPLTIASRSIYHLRKIDLSNNLITDDGAYAFSKLRNYNNIEELNLSNNDISEVASDHLFYYFGNALII